MGSQIGIRCAEQLYRAEKAKVEIVINFDRPTKVRCIHAVFTGREKTEAEYTDTQRDHDGKRRSVTKTATEYVEIVKEQFLLMGEEPRGFFGNIGDSFKTVFGGGSAQIIEPGIHKFAVDVMVPADAPPTIKGDNCEVTYEIKVSVDIPIKFDWTSSKEMLVARLPVDFSDTQPIHVVFPDEDGRSFVDKIFGKDVTLNLAVDRDQIRVGESASAMLTVDTLEPLKVKKIECALVGHEKTQARSHSDSATHRINIGTIDSPNIISGNSVHKFEIEVPDFDGPFTQQGTNFSVKWHVELRLDVPWARDPVILAPIEFHPSNTPKKI